MELKAVFFSRKVVFLLLQLLLKMASGMRIKSAHTNESPHVSILNIYFNVLKWINYSEKSLSDDPYQFYYWLFMIASFIDSWRFRLLKNKIFPCWIMKKTVVPFLRQLITMIWWWVISQRSNLCARKTHFRSQLIF